MSCFRGPIGLKSFANTCHLKLNSSSRKGPQRPQTLTIKDRYVTGSRRSWTYSRSVVTVQPRLDTRSSTKSAMYPAVSFMTNREKHGRGRSAMGHLALAVHLAMPMRCSKKKEAFQRRRLTPIPTQRFDGDRKSTRL